MLKRVFDIAVSLAGLTALAPLLLIVSLLVKLSSPGPVFFRHLRVGRGFRKFHVFKFRTMVQDASRQGAEITSAGDSRVTPFGRVLRRTKIDEIPQLFNVLKGDMSLVGPRPEAPKYVEMFRRDYEQILSVLPGITDLASLKYHDEEAYLGRFHHAEEQYVNSVLPDKIALAKDYISKSSFLFDLRLIVATIWTVSGRAHPWLTHRF
jgi:lipopolysaccharide/colanic/teichoic acid biosynthesis glycosyltransferase